MTELPPNPSLSPYFRIFTAIVTLVLLIGGGLFFTPQAIQPRWLWALPPFHTRFLGAIYLAQMVGVVSLLISNRWAPARMALPIGMLFTAHVSIVSLLNAHMFNFERRATWAWFGLYIGSTLILLFVLWAHRHLKVTGVEPPAAWMRNLLRVQGTVQGLYGLGLLLMPAVFGSFWPWAIDAFHAQLYSSIFITWALVMFPLAQRGTPIEFMTLGATQITFGLFAILGVLIVDSQVHRVVWNSVGVWGWMAGFSALVILGAIIGWYGLRNRVSTNPEIAS